jgi:hypothetical protein
VEAAFSTPLNELPSFLSSISMVVDDRTSIVRSLTQAERKSPTRYEPAKDLFCRVLQGDFTFAEALTQAGEVADSTERKHAVDILRASARFLVSESPARVGAFPTMNILIPNGMKLAVTPLWLRHLAPPRLMILHFWLTPLTPRQLSAAAAVLRAALLIHHPAYSGCELDFISVSQPDGAPARNFERYSWTKIKPLSETDLAYFWRQFCEAWSEYQKRGPRTFYRRRQTELF